ncbi:MAG: hypothetical protein AB7R89_13790 [Dehalococcoidia bacterium]
MQYTYTLPERPKPPTVGAHGAAASTTVRCAICTGPVPVERAIMTERIDPDEHTWYTEHLCQGCADPADLLLDRLIREGAARRVAG